MSKGPVIYKYPTDVAEVRSVVWYSGDGWNPPGYRVYVKLKGDKVAYECHIAGHTPRDGALEIIEVNKGEKKDDRD